MACRTAAARVQAPGAQKRMAKGVTSASYQTFRFPTDGTEPWEKRTPSQSVSRSSEGLPCHSSGSEECLSATLHSEQPHHMWGYDEQKQKGCLHMEFRARRLKQHSLLRTTTLGCCRCPAAVQSTNLGWLLAPSSPSRR